MSQEDTAKTDDNNVSKEDTIKTDKSSASGKVSVEIKTKYIVYAVLIMVLIMVFALSLRYVEMPSSADDTQTTVDIAGDVDVNDVDISSVDMIPDDIASPEPLVVADDTVDAYIPEAGEIVISLDETASTDALDVSLDSYVIVSSYVYQTEEGGIERADMAIGGKEFIMANFTVVNKGTTSVYIGYGKVTLLSNIYTYEPIVYEGYDGLPKYEKISPGAEMSGIVVFEIPSNSEDVRIRYSLSGLSISERFVTWFL